MFLIFTLLWVSRKILSISIKTNLLKPQNHTPNPLLARWFSWVWIKTGQTSYPRTRTTTQEVFLSNISSQGAIRHTVRSHWCIGCAYTAVFGESRGWCATRDVFFFCCPALMERALNVSHPHLFSADSKWHLNGDWEQTKEGRSSRNMGGEASSKCCLSPTVAILELQCSARSPCPASGFAAAYGARKCFFFNSHTDVGIASLTKLPLSAASHGAFSFLQARQPLPQLVFIDSWVNTSKNLN